MWVKMQTRILLILFAFIMCITLNINNIVEAQTTNDSNINYSSPTLNEDIWGDFERPIPFTEKNSITWIDMIKGSLAFFVLLMVIIKFV